MVKHAWIFSFDLVSKSYGRALTKRKVYNKFFLFLRGPLVPSLLSDSFQTERKQQVIFLLGFDTDLIAKSYSKKYAAKK